MRLIFLLYFFSSITLWATSYTVGRDPTWYPYDFQEKTGDVNGYINQLISDIAKKEDLKITIINKDPLSLLQGLQTNEYDSAVSIVLMTDENKGMYHFSKPLLNLGQVLVVGKNSNATSLEQLAGKIVGISPFDDSVFIVQKIPSILMRPFQSLPIALKALAKGEIDGVLLPALGAHGLIESEFSNTLKIVTDPLSHRGIHLIVLQKKHDALVDSINQALARFEKNGYLKNLQKQFRIY